MKLLFKITALCLCLVLVLGAAGCAKETDATKIVVAKVNGDNIYRSDLDTAYEQTLQTYAQYEAYGYSMGFDETKEEDVTTLKNNILEQLIASKVEEQQMKTQGFDKLTNEQIDEQKKAVDEFIANYKDQIRSSLDPSSNADATASAEPSASASASPSATASTSAADLEKQVEEQWQALVKQSGTTEEKLREDLLNEYIKNAKLENFEKSITDKVTVADTEIKTWYDENLKTQQDELKTDPSKYESHLSSDIALSVPEGIVKAKQILVKVAEDKSETAKSLYGEGKTEDAFAVLASEFTRIQPRADEVLAKVKAGEDFDKLVETYNDDSGMKEEPQKTEGYTVVPNNSTYMKEFTEAALALKNLGDTSGLVKTIYGYHILKNVGTITPGPIAMDTVKDKIKEKLLTEKKDKELSTQKEAWKKAAKIEYFKEKMFIEIKAPATSAPASSSPAASAPAAQ